MNISKKQPLLCQAHGTWQNTNISLLLKKTGQEYAFPVLLRQKKVRFWTDLWLQNKKMSVKASTYVRYKNLIQHHIDPYLGDFKIGSIRPQTIEIYLAYLLKNGRLDNRGGLSAKMVSDILSVLKNVFRLANNYGAVRSSWFAPISVRQEEASVRVLSRCEEEKLFAFLSENTDNYKLGVLIAMYSGIRIGELCALRWKDISLTDKVMRIHKTMQRLQNEKTDSVSKTEIVITAPKSMCANRIIPLTDFLVKKMETFAAEPEAFLLSGSRNVLVEPRTMQNKVQSYFKKCSIQGASFHTLRHTFATRCVEIGFDIKTLSEILGHSSVKITLDRYVHTSLDQKRQNMEKIVI